MSLRRRWQAVKFQLQWGREQEDAGACSQAGLISEVSGDSCWWYLYLVCILPIPCMLLPVTNVLMLLGLCNGEFTLQWWCSECWPNPNVKMETWGKHLSCERCALPAFSSFCPYDSDRDDSSTIKISTSFSVMIHSTFLFPLIKEGTSRWSRLNTIRWLRLDGEISIRAIRNELRAFGSSGSSLSGR